MLVLLVPREVFRLAEVPIVISCNDFGWDRRESLREFAAGNGLRFEGLVLTGSV